MLEKLILVAESNGGFRHVIAAALAQRGFRNLASVDGAQQVFSRLRQTQSVLGSLGAVIVGDSLPSDEIHELCSRLADIDGGLGIPVIVLLDKGNDALRKRLAPLEPVVVSIHRKTAADDLPAIVTLAIASKLERDRRLRQETRLAGALSQSKVEASRAHSLIATDELTGLASRHNFEKELLVALYKLKEFRQDCALLYFDIDRFSCINDLEGYDAGDALLVDVVKVWRGVLPQGHVAARICGDEFCVLLNRTTAEHAYTAAESARHAVGEHQFRVKDESYQLTLSVGVVLLSSVADAEHPGQLLSLAHRAASIAKSNGRNGVYVYHEDDQAEMLRTSDIRWASRIRDALRDSSFYLVFQPIVRLSDGLISHYETLIRMRDSNGAKDLSPADFIPAAERMGLIHKIDFWVLHSALEYLAGLPPELSHVGLSINLSTVALQHESLLTIIRLQLERLWIDPSRVTFEITETAAADNFKTIRDSIMRLRALGCRFSLDDFGAGFCTFSYLKRFPVDFVKLDGQFVRNLVSDEVDQILVRAMVDIAQKLKKRVVAEYVDSPETLHMLRDIGVDYVQGYLIGKPSEQILKQEFFTFPEIAGDSAESTLLQFPGGPDMRSTADDGLNLIANNGAPR